MGPQPQGRGGGPPWVVEGRHWVNVGQGQGRHGSCVTTSVCSCSRPPRPGPINKHRLTDGFPCSPAFR